MRPSRSRAEILRSLTEQQREAVCFGEGPLLVVAGAGSGKTRVITHRIAYLLSEGVQPDRILAVTFTNKAAGEMRRRVEELVGEDELVTTFHSFCSRLLRRGIHRLGMDPSFSIYDRGDSLRLVRQVVKQLNLDRQTYQPSRLLDMISALKDDVVSAEQYQQKALGIKERALAQVYELYEQRLRDNSALDFDDLLLRTLELFRQHPDVLQQYQDAYQHVLIDEYQDTNLPQHLIARALQGKHKNMTAVGDPDQMIYSWRGARLANIMEFEQDFPGAHVVKLEQNYRSTANILRAASVCISHNVKRREKRLWCDNEAGEPVIVKEFENPFEEGSWVAAKTNELIELGTRAGQIAVFYRTRHQSLAFEDSFSSLALPYQVVDGVGFLERKQTKDLRAYIQLLVNPRDDEAFMRVINSPRRGIGAKTLEKLQREARSRRLPLLRAAMAAGELESLSGRTRKALAEFCTLYEELSALEFNSVESFFVEIVERTGYLAGTPEEERDEVAEMLDYFQSYAREHDRRMPGGSLAAFLEQAALVSGVDGWNSSAVAVPLMTLHSAKGLEFDAVFIVGLDEGLLPHSRSLSEDCGDVLDSLEEERRLLHVGMTRARKHLFLTHARRRFSHGREREATPSRFLGELPDDCVVREQAPADAESLHPARRFASEMDQVLASKRAPSPAVSLQRDEGEEPRPGAAVEHPRYGEGQILEVTLTAGHYAVKVDFGKEGIMTLLLPKGEARSS